MYMLNQRLTTAVRDGYRGAHPRVVADELAAARRTIAWFKRLRVDGATKASLVEPVAAIEEALAEIERISSRHAGTVEKHPAA